MRFRRKLIIYQNDQFHKDQQIFNRHVTLLPITNTKYASHFHMDDL